MFVGSVGERGNGRSGGSGGSSSGSGGGSSGSSGSVGVHNFQRIEFTHTQWTIIFAQNKKNLYKIL